MNVWAVSNMPVYRVERETRHKGSRKSKFQGPRSPSSETAPHPIRPVTACDGYPHDASSIDGLLDPAIDGPPSPESLRELSRQMRRASVRDKHRSHQTSSSGSSSLRSLTSADRPSSENAFEGRTLSRNSSGRSTSSSMPSRERPDSVQIFGKTFFNRRGKMRRESSAQSSSSSLYSTDASVMSLPPTSAPNRDSIVPALFGLRRGAKRDQVAETQRRLPISGPYNFQHVTHAQRDQPGDLQRTNQTVAASIKANNGLHFADLSSDSLPLNEEDVVPSPQPTTKLKRDSSGVKKASSSRRLLKRSQSQEQLNRGIPPPRPPRSPPADASVMLCPPIPPPRGSSRSSVRHERFGSGDRPRTSGSSHASQHFPAYADSWSPPATSHGYVPAPEMNVIPEHADSHAITPLDDANWPLPCPSSTASEFTLPKVPEEDEGSFALKKSRASITSNSSLRGSQSVPMLRVSSMGQDDESARRCSQASDTLGRFDLFAAQRALKAALLESGRDEALPRESWEDDIDYCYEHAAEADCDYEWDRPSIETSRDGDSATPVDDHERDMAVSEASSPAMPAAGQFDVPALSPALSPASRLSVATAQEAITPTTGDNAKASNFSLPRVDSKNLLHVRKPSDASSFKESHGFTLSPSLLIPMDYQQQMMACEAEIQEVSDSDFGHFGEPGPDVDQSTLLMRYRTSASTASTTESTSSAFEKHTSTASTSTEYTRLTQSTSSLDIENYLPKSEPLQRFPSLESPGKVESKSAMPTVPGMGEAARSSSGRRDFGSRGSESNLGRLAMDEPWPGKGKMPMQAKRGRSRTTSLSTPPPPNQYALFPSVQLRGNRI